MKIIRKIASLIFIILFITGCDKNHNYKINDELVLSGTISSSKVTDNGETKIVNILKLNSPITINNTKIKKIELFSDKELKDDANVSITGRIEEGNDNSQLDFSYLLYVLSVDDNLSYVNTFQNDSFAITIPSELIPISTIKRIDNGFIIYSTNNMDNGGEVFRILSVSNESFEEITKSENSYIEKITANEKETIVITYPTTEEYREEYKDEYIQIGNQISQIKKNIKMF